MALIKFLTSAAATIVDNLTNLIFGEDGPTVVAEDGSAIQHE